MAQQTTDRVHCKHANYNRLVLNPSKQTKRKLTFKEPVMRPNCKRKKINKYNVSHKPGWRDPKGLKTKRKVARPLECCQCRHRRRGKWSHHSALHKQKSIRIEYWCHTMGFQVITREKFQSKHQISNSLPEGWRQGSDCCEPGNTGLHDHICRMSLDVRDISWEMDADVVDGEDENK